MRNVNIIHRLGRVSSKEIKVKLTTGAHLTCELMDYKKAHVVFGDRKRSFIPVALTKKA
jgi:hypothetical protein